MLEGKFGTFVTQKPLNSGHLWLLKNVSVIERCPLLGSNLKKIVTFGIYRFVRYSWYVRPLFGMSASGRFHCNLINNLRKISHTKECDFKDVSVHIFDLSDTILFFAFSHFGLLDPLFSMYAKFSQNLTFLTPWYAHVHVRIKG